MKKLTLYDYQKIKPYLDLADYEGYNSNFVTMMMWNHEYHIEYEIHDHFLIMLHHFKDTHFWAMPFTSPQYYQEAIDYMISYSQNHHFDFMIDCAIEAFVEKIKPLYKDRLLFERTPYNDDYIYDKNILQTLSGKKMQKRRNHYNSFLKNYPQYEYKELDAEKDFDLILDCINHWENEKDDLSESMTSEVYGIMYLLSCKKMLDYEIGGIFIDNVMQAFIIASRLNHQTIQIHVEKANKNIRGLYPAILKELLEHHFSEELYVNREEDMGLENLRKSKMSLHPIKMIHKYKIILKDIHINQPNDNDQKRIIQLWRESFSDEDELSTHYYFKYLYNKEHTYVLRQSNRILSVVQIVPFEIENRQDCYFILGVCTDQYYQNQGLMKMLMNYVLNIYIDKYIYLQAYHPEIYESFGFHASHFHQIVKLDKKELYQDDILIVSPEKSLLKAYYEAFTSKYREYRIRNEIYWELLLKRCEAFHDQIVCFKNRGYIIYHETEENIYVSECIYLSQDDLKHMLNYFYNYQKTVKIECDLKAYISGNSQKIITMMSNHDRLSNHVEELFINEIY